MNTHTSGIKMMEIVHISKRLVRDRRDLGVFHHMFIVMRHHFDFIMSKSLLLDNYHET
jgi:hypothetical protein